MLHHRPIKVLFSNRPKRPHLEARFPLRCFQRLSLRSVATQRMPLAEQLVHQWLPHPGPLVQRATLLKPLSPAADRDRPVSRRSEPSSRTPLIGEQPNPWDLLQPQDGMSRHRVPSLAVDVNSRARLACYPRGNFCPLIDDPSTQSPGH